MSVFFWYLGKSDLSSVHVYSNIRTLQISNFFYRVPEKRLCLTIVIGHPVQYDKKFNSVSDWLVLFSLWEYQIRSSLSNTNMLGMNKSAC